jgi:soluble lytic murein transglycosylase-like protein
MRGVAPQRHSTIYFGGDFALSFSVARLLATVTLVGALASPASGAADEIYSFVDGDGVIHYTNVPQDARYRVVIASTAGRVAPPLPRRTSAFDEHIRAAAQKYGLAPPLVKAVMAAESNFNPAAISEKGATGLMQLMPETARDMSVHDLLDPAQNIEGGARYLRLLHDQFGGDLKRVLAAYNAGPERVRRSGGAVPAIPETQAYVRKVLALYKAYMNGG